MADISYNVDAQLKVSGGEQFRGGLTGAAKAADGLKTSVAGLASIAGGLADLASRAVAVGGAFSTAGLAAGLALGGGLARGIGANLSMLENKSIEMATVIGAAASVPFETAQQAASGLFEQFRKDAVTSAGETADFIGIASGLTGPILGAGKGMVELHDLTKSVVAAAPALGASFQQAGSDVMRMLQGVAGVEQPLFRAMVGIPSLGIRKAEEFNKLAPDKRYELVAKSLNNPAFKAAAGAMGSSLTGLVSTGEDIIKTMGGLVGGPAFGLVKKGLASLTTSGLGLLDDKNFRTKLGLLGSEAELTARRMAAQFGRIFPEFGAGAHGALDIVTNLATVGMGKLVDGSRWIVDHWGEIKTFAMQTADFVTNAAKQAETFVRAFGGGDFATGAKGLAEAFVLTKGAQAASPVLSGVGDVAKGLGGLSGAVGGSTAAGTSLLAASGMFVAAASAILGASVGMVKGVEAFNAWEVKTGRRFQELDGAALTPTDKTSGLPFNVMPGAEALKGLQIGGLDFAHAPTGAPGELTIPGAATTAPGQALPQSVAFLPALSAAPDPQGAVTAESLTGLSPETPVARLVEMYDQSIVANDEGTARMAAALLVQSGKSASDIENMGLSLAGGLDKFGETLRGSGEEMLRKLQAFATNPTPVIPTGKAPAPSHSGGGQTITIKWDLGDGNDEAIFVRTRREMVQMVQAAKGSVRGPRVPGVF